jgi:hypothetical protein
VFGVIVKVVLVPPLTTTDPLGDIEPFVPELAVMVKVLIAKLAAMVWFAVTLVKVKLPINPFDTPSTTTSAT